MRTKVKAELIAAGAVDMDPILLGHTTIPTAGPGAGRTAFFFSSGGHRVRLGIDPSSSLKGKKEGRKLVIMKDGQEIARGILEEELIHCPDQAFITMCETCIFDCKFCPVPKLQGKVKTIDEMLSMIAQAHATGKMHAISITSGVEISPEKEVNRAEELICRLRERYTVPIGVSVYPTKDSTRRLKDAGADELKYNVETMDREIFSKVCPGGDLADVLASLHEGVEIFGHNKVCSNFIIGLGETDRSAMKGIEELVAMGVVPILRAASPHPLRIGEVFIERPSADRLIRLTRFLREKLDEYGLQADAFQTMCLPCAGCDLNPHSDME
ncbi:MAG: radical SAM protein [Methanomethylovorans sp.]|uniref:radical SAM protein n=1 Tax=Methanomethylovorans sp. TaxID=2758717 RepID=UPI000AB5CE4B|nr:radical SAM protein [Methanomethylovorans sp.]